MKFNVEIREILSRVITVEASNPNEAGKMIREMYENSEIVLDYNDMLGEEDIQVMDGEVPADFPVDVVVCQHLDNP